MKPDINVYVISFFLLAAVFFRGAESEAKTPFPLGEQESWMGIYFKDHKLGFSHTLARTTPDSIQINSKMYIHLKAGGRNQITSFNQETHLTPDMRLRKFSFLEAIMGHRLQVSAHPENGQLVMQLNTLGYKKTKFVPFPADAVLSSTYLFNLLNDGLKVGEKGSLPIFMEPLQTFSNVEYEVLRKESVDFAGHEIETLVILQNIGGMESTLWITPEGDVLRESSVQGFESLKETKEAAQNLGEDTMSVSSFITLSLVKAQKEIANPGLRKQGRYKLSNLRSANLIPNDHRQEVLQVTPQTGKKFIADLMVNTEAILKESPLAIAELPFPANDFLGDSPEIQSSHPLIRSLAREIIKDERDSWQAAQNINTWVFNNLEKVLVDSFTALDALRERRGECQSHTNLYVALARAGGIPAKVVNGLVYSGDYHGFVYHAWPEVYIGEWRALDPTFGQHAVDATHIKLSEGEKDNPLKMMEFIGKLQIKIMDD